MKERTCVLIKPDGVCKRLIGEILRRIESEGFKIVALKMIRPEQEKIEEFYEPHKGKPFFSGLVKFMLTAPCVVMVVEGENAVRRVRELIGDRVPAEATKGSIRGDFGSDGKRNVVHGSDSLDSARREISCFFSSKEIFFYGENDWLNSEPG
ncbi:nucleoside-diphosphate kinase [Candidatus Aerophobetes bacterium]|uniref:Nucleoside diphosphate kinase n=1 Tax=Aerophobetes bacterium TaxID=2030807 RepID=A0A662DIE8_UNCAE|nr:MAG: nucleoside-diphosphate kinase [Candidatus Aerophobetes bacterium]